MPCPPSRVSISAPLRGLAGQPSLHPCPVFPAARAPGDQEHEACVATAPGCSVPHGVWRATGWLRGDRSDGHPVLRAGALPQAWLCCVGSCGAHGPPSALSAGAPAALELGIIPVSWGGFDRRVAELCRPAGATTQEQGRGPWGCAPGSLRSRPLRRREGRPPARWQ